MASNPYVNKVEYDGQTLMDLTGDTVTPGDMILGKTAHDRSGAPITGTYDPTSIIDDTAGAGDTDVVFSADKVLALIGNMPNIYTQTITITTDSNGVATLYSFGVNSYAILSATIVRDGSAYNSWAGFIPSASGDGFLSLKMVDNGVNPVKSLPNTTAKVKMTVLRLNNIPVAT